jgi:hypothetical protein
MTSQRTNGRLDGCQDLFVESLQRDNKPHIYPKNENIWIGFKGTLKRNFKNLKKQQNPKDLRILVLYSDLQHSSCKYPFQAMQSVANFPAKVLSHRYAQQRTKKQKK